MGAPGTTEGPWAAIKGAEKGDDMRCAVVATRGDLAYLVATIENGAPGDFCDTEFANAHQMAASGALYDALEAVSGHLPNFPDPDDGPDDIACEIALEWREVHAIRAALALARGESQ